MSQHPGPDDVVQRLILWAQPQDGIRAVILTSTRTNPNATLDAFSDYDVVLVATDIHPFYEDGTWREQFGRVLVLYEDPIHADPHYGLEKFTDVTQYEDGLKIDFSLWPVELLKRIVADSQLPPDLDLGYTVLLDKDHLTNRLRPPTYRAYIPTPPSEEAFRRVVEVFLSETCYVAKNLERDELLPAKYSLDHIMKQKYLRQMLEWRMEVDHDWSAKTGALGKGLKKQLSRDIWARLESTYVGADRQENWEALFKTIDLFRQVALVVGDDLGYPYPEDLHRRVVEYLQRVKQHPS